MSEEEFPQVWKMAYMVAMIEPMKQAPNVLAMEGSTINGCEDIMGGKEDAD